MIPKLTGKCQCKANVEGEDCSSCKLGFYGDLSKLIVSGNTTIKPECKKCDCDPEGLSTFQTSDFTCDRKTGQCSCKNLRAGIKCDQCITGYFKVSFGNIDCLQCNCHPTGSIPGTFCDIQTGECTCKVYNGIGGTRCNECLWGFYKFSAETGS